MESVEVIILDQTKPISQAGFGVPLVLDISKNVPYTEVTDPAEIPLPLVNTDMAYKMVNTLLSQEPAPSKVAVYGYDFDQVGAEKTITDILNALVVEHNDWFYLLLADRVDTNIKTTAAWANSSEKFFVSGNAPSELVTAIIARAAAINSDNSSIFAHDGDPDSEDVYLDAAIVGRMAPLRVGSATWKFKSLQGIPVATYLNADVTLLHNANVNTYVSDLGELVTSEGKTTSGKFIDLVIAKQYLKARIKEDFVRMLHRNDKIPYDDTGIAMAGAELKKRFQYEETSGLIAKDANGNGLWEIYLPKRANIPENDRANRILPDIEWEVTVAGAVHTMKITGVLKV